MRILVINPTILRFDQLGACEQDRLINLSELSRLGHTVLLLTQSSRHRTAAEHREYYAQANMPAQIVPYRNQRFHPARARDLAFLDGAAWEYAMPRWREAVDEVLRTWRPDVVWCHASYLWPSAARARRAGIPTVIRSVNYESIHLLQQDGYSVANWLRFIGKELGERRTLRYASVLAAITPDETRLYERRSPHAAVYTLPLRALPALLRPPHPTTARRPLHAFMMGASYNVPHNRTALEFVVKQVAPLVRERAPGSFVFHILGSKAPAALQAYAAPDLIFEGYVEDLEGFLTGMDIALAPSLSGQGMQQKVFEPLCRGIPTVAHRRALAGYPFQDGLDVLLADDAAGFTAQLVRLEDAGLRRMLAAGASERAASLFSEAALDQQVGAILEQTARSKASARL